MTTYRDYGGDLVLRVTLEDGDSPPGLRHRVHFRLLAGGFLRVACDCPAWQLEGLCQHILAVLRLDETVLSRSLRSVEPIARQEGRSLLDVLADELSGLDVSDIPRALQEYEKATQRMREDGEGNRTEQQCSEAHSVRRRLAALLANAPYPRSPGDPRWN